ncbi:hypothetical protein WOLCODRAFT_162813 [Wolfiporia cocos MD-104 SS10]|uniref:Uncharacterized protein n=1 Tax=Wolfiporia cocos (strain MD-104) TaxID=742152 RepID=A0A2H3JWK4_WOLCO|nr:hypothetical protein WOLCODRAFT_162813 [Wolfiporia cocos MD-104 SS10]
MRFGPRNAYYLRISEHTVLPLYVYLDERHIDWMSERVLQHVLEDLRPRILQKLRDESDSHSGPKAKGGTVDVHRGGTSWVLAENVTKSETHFADTYQFGYFLRKTDPHAVLIKTRHFVPAPDPPQGVVPPRSPSPPTTSAHKGKKRTPKKAAKSARRTKKAKTKGKQRARDSDEEEDAISISSGEDDDAHPPTTSTTAIPMTPRRSTRAKKVIAGGYREEDEDIREDPGSSLEGDVDIEMHTPAGDAPNADMAPADAPMPLDDVELIGMDEVEDVASPVIKHEATESTLDMVPSSISPEPIPDPVSEEILDVTPTRHNPHEDEEEDMKKLIMQLRYRGFNIHGQCLCVIVEPYPPIRATMRPPPRAPSVAAAAFFTPRAPSIAPPDFVPSGGGGQRARTPLFLPEDNREGSVIPAPGRPRTLPPVPLFNEVTDDSSDDDGMMTFTQILRSVGTNQAGAVENDDEIEGAVFFGDADESREL